MVFGMWLGRDAIQRFPLSRIKLFVWLEVLMAIIADWPSCVISWRLAKSVPLSGL